MCVYNGYGSAGYIQILHAIASPSSESGDQASAGAGVPGWSWRQFLFGTTGGGTSAIPSEETGGIIEEIKICLAA